MPFDGRNAPDPLPVRKVFYAPQAPFVGPVLATNLRNAYAYSRTASRGMLAQCWPRDLTNPESYHDNLLFVVSTSPVTILTDRRYVAAHYTHFRAHVCFSIIDGVDDVFLTLDAALDTSPPTPMATATQELQLSKGSAARIPEGAVFEARGGSYEIMGELDLVNSIPGVPLPCYTWFRLQMYGTQPSGGARVAGPVILDSASIWLEARD